MAKQNGGVKTMSRARNPKQEIVESYGDLLKQVQEQKTEDPRKVKKVEEEQSIVQKTSELSAESIMSSSSQLKIGMAKVLDELSEKLVGELKKFQEARRAVETEQKSLEEMYGIKTQTDSLAALILAQQKKEEEFDCDFESKRQELEREIEEQRTQWEKAQDQKLTERKEEEDLNKRERKREEEEYSYNLSLTRKKDQDVYEAHKAVLEKELTERKLAFEKEIQERQTSITKQEEEFKQLKGKVDQFPEELNQAKKSAEKEVGDRLEFKYKYQIELTNKEIEGERRLNEQRVRSLEAKIKEQSELIAQLTQRSDEAGIKVENIALKAIEGASFQKAASLFNPRQPNDSPSESRSQGQSSK